MTVGKWLKIDVTVLHILVQSARLALHEHIPAFSCAVGTDHRALEDSPNIAQMDE